MKLLKHQYPRHSTMGQNEGHKTITLIHLLQHLDKARHLHQPQQPNTISQAYVPFGTKNLNN